MSGVGGVRKEGVGWINQVTRSPSKTLRHWEEGHSYVVMR